MEIKRVAPEPLPLPADEFVIRLSEKEAKILRKIVNSIRWRSLPTEASILAMELGDSLPYERFPGPNSYAEAELSK